MTDDVTARADNARSDAPSFSAATDKADPEAWLVAADARLAEGQAANLAAAAEALSRALELRPLDLAIRNKLLLTMTAADEARGVGPASGRLKLTAPTDPIFYLTMVDFYLRHGRAKSVPRLAAIGLTRFPTTIGLHRRWLDALQALGRGGEAAKALKFATGLPPETVRSQGALLQRGADMLRAAGEVEAEFQLLERLAELFPRDDIPKLRLRGRAWEAGRDEWAESYNALLVEHYACHLPKTLNEGLEALWRTSRKQHLPEQGVQRAWSMADQKRWPFEEWLAAAKWGSAARELLRQWFVANPDGGAQIEALTESADVSLFDQACAGPVAGILAGAHLGQILPVFQLLKAHGIPFHYLSTAWVEQVDGASKMVIGLREVKTTTMRELICCVKRPGVVGVAMDTPGREDRARVEISGCSVFLSNLPPRLAFRYGCPTYWCMPLWRGERVVWDMARLPDPRSDEVEAAFVDRWMGAFAECFERVLRGDPRNLAPASKVWRSMIPHEEAGANAARP